jgi:hypothetical protein
MDGRSHRSRTVSIGLRIGAGLLVFLAGGAMIGAPGWAPPAVALALVTASWPLAMAWRAARGTELRSAVIWGGVAVVLGVAAQGFAWLEPLESGRPGAGHLAYLSVLATLAALISVLNARSPGGGAWAILMGLLVLVFLIPWLEGPLRPRAATGLGQLRLDAPWSLFYGLLVVAGVSNYLPTRYGPAALWLAAGFVLEYLGLSRSDWAAARRGVLWSAVPWTLAVAVWVAEGRSRRRAGAGSGLEATWLWFRDHWGVVWALRVQERFNRTAVSARWPFRLSWYGVVPADAGPGPAPSVPEEAEATLKGLLRRFAQPARIDEASARKLM